eukprot:1160437-Pelagomonas_calceolata.AAC.14
MELGHASSFNAHHHIRSAQDMELGHTSCIGAAYRPIESAQSIKQGHTSCADAHPTMLCAGIQLTMVGHAGVQLTTMECGVQLAMVGCAGVLLAH